MNGIIAAQIAVEATREQFTFHSDGCPDPTPKRTSRRIGLTRLFRLLAAWVDGRSRRPAREAREAC